MNYLSRAIQSNLQSRRHILIKYKKGRRVIHKFMQCFFSLFTDMSVVKYDIAASQCEYFVLPPRFLFSESLTWNYPNTVLVYFFFSFCSCDAFPFWNVGKWLRVSGHSGSHCGRPGRECSCSSVQWRPGHEASGQGWPGRHTCYYFILCLHPHSNLWK